MAKIKNYYMRTVGSKIICVNVFLQHAHQNTYSLVKRNAPHFQDKADT
jgi:hypothetical protein